MPTYCLDLTCLNTLARHRGIGRYASSLAQALHDARALLAPDERLVGLFEHNGSVWRSRDLQLTEHLRPLPAPNLRKKHYERYFDDRGAKVSKGLRDGGVDVMHFIQGVGAVPSQRYRSVVTCHDLIPQRFAAEYVRGRWWRMPVLRVEDWERYALCERVIAISGSTRDDLGRFVGVHPARISVIGHGVDHARFQPVAEPGERARITAKYGLPGRYVLYVGAVDPRKRLALLVDRAEEIQRTLGVTVVLAGSSWPRVLTPALRRSLAKAAPGAVCLAGEIHDDDLPALYRQAEAHVLPSIFEGFGLSVIESMACGCPVVTTRGGALGEVGGDAARFVACDDGDALVAALRDVTRDAELRAKMVAEGRAHALTFTWARAARETLAAYRLAVGRSAAALALTASGSHEGVTEE